jgi:Spy/CpxP family protein refolding chaperone
MQRRLTIAFFLGAGLAATAVLLAAAAAVAPELVLWMGVAVGLVVALLLDTPAPVSYSARMAWKSLNREDHEIK